MKWRRRTRSRRRAEWIVANAERITGPMADWERELAIRLLASRDMDHQEAMWRIAGGR